MRGIDCFRQIIYYSTFHAKNPTSLFVKIAKRLPAFLDMHFLHLEIGKGKVRALRKNRYSIKLARACCDLVTVLQKKACWIMEKRCASNQNRWGDLGQLLRSRVPRHASVGEIVFQARKAYNGQAKGLALLIQSLPRHPTLLVMKSG